MGLFSAATMVLHSALCSRAITLFGIIVFGSLLAGCKEAGNSFLQFTADFTGPINSTNPSAHSFFITANQNAFALPRPSPDGTYTVTYTDASDASCSQEYEVNALNDEVLASGLIDIIIIAPVAEDPDNDPFDPRDTENRVRLFKNCSIQVERHLCDSENCSLG